MQYPVLLNNFEGLSDPEPRIDLDTFLDIFTPYHNDYLRSKMGNKGQRLHYRIFYITIDNIFSDRLIGRDYKNEYFVNAKRHIKYFCTEMNGPVVDDTLDPDVADNV
jgi:hypothetical protein